MMCRFRAWTIDRQTLRTGMPGPARPVHRKAKARYRGVGLAEVVASLVILGLFSSGILVIVNRCMDWATDSALRMQAFEVARENIEALLSLDSVKEMSESGESEQYPGIEWETNVETFYEPVTSRMWVRCVCGATYEDAAW